jgi:hypothetical protein
MVRIGAAKSGVAALRRQVALGSECRDMGNLDTNVNR